MHKTIFLAKIGTNLVVLAYLDTIIQEAMAKYIYMDSVASLCKQV